MLAVVAYVVVLKVFEKPITYFFATLKKFYRRVKESTAHVCIVQSCSVIIFKPKQQPSIGLRCGYLFQFLLI
jgi:hypothetical protein